MDKGNQIDCVYTDYSKAFDRIDHDLLIDKLSNIGIRGDLLRWFSSYIKNRSQVTVLNNYISGWLPIPSGVPQGSLLGPLLFIIYVNDIAFCLKFAKLLCFADDMKIYAIIKSSADVINFQSDLSNLEIYCRTNKLDLNPSKCSIITYTRKRFNITANYSLGGQTLTRSNCVRDLGVLHDCKLTFELQIEAIIDKASKALGFVMRMSKCFTEAKTLKILYCTYVRSHLEYASQAWSPYYHKYIDRIEMIQRRFIKYLCYRQKIPYHSDNYLSLCKKFHILPLKTRREIADYTLLFKTMTNELDCPQLLSKFSINVPTKFTRFSPPLAVPTASTNYRQNSYVVRVSRSFNKLCRDYDFDLFITNATLARKTLSCKFFNNCDT